MVFDFNRISIKSGTRGRRFSSVNTMKFDSSRNLNLYICTWNVNTKQPLFELDKLLKFDENEKPDICAFGLQEVNSKPFQRLIDYFFNDPWTNKLTYTLGKLGYVRIKTTRLVGIILNIFVKRDILLDVRYCIENWVRIGFFGLWGNKGANSCTLNIGGVNICFINTHLSAHEQQSQKRKIEYSTILDNQKAYNLSQKEIVLKEDYQFIFGDLNFRIEGLPIDEVKKFINNKEYKKLLEYDQLKNSISLNEPNFSHLKEKNINFPPTYKFDPNTDTYDTSSKKRVPSWCDRILHRFDPKCKNSDFDHIECEQISYNHIPDYSQSDHKPVFAEFQIKVGNFEIQKPDMIFNEVKNKNGFIEIQYQINANIVTHQCDWIGVFKENFCSSEEYLTYIYPERILEFENKNLSKEMNYDPNLEISVVKRKVILKNDFVGISGNYQIGYFSNISRNLIGLSSVFELQI